MAASIIKTDLVAIVGPTASGKSSLAMDIASKFNGEIICADSRTVYKGLDIGTAKPNVSDKAKIKHHLLDIVDIGRPFSAADFKKQANLSIQDIKRRGKLPILVGGTGLYVDSVIFDFGFISKPDLKERERLNSLSLEELQSELEAKKIAMPVNYKNKRHLIRAIETNGVTRKDLELNPGTIVVGMSSEDLSSKISSRVDAMFEQGLEAEVQKLSANGHPPESIDAIGYKEWGEYFNNKITLEKLKENIVKNSVKYAKRQRTWFKRNPYIHWFSDKDSATEYIIKELNN